MNLQQLQELSSLHLRYAPGSGKLLDLAIGQLVAKALFVSGSLVPVQANQLVADIRELTDVLDLSSDLVQASLISLNQDGLVERQGGGWVLTKHGLDSIERDLSEHSRRVNAILDRRFPKGIDRQTLNSWFSEAISAIFAEYGNHAAAVVFRIRDHHSYSRQRMRRTVADTTSTHDLSDYEVDLWSGIEKLIVEPQPDEELFIWSIWQSSFAARILTAKLGADPITTEELRSSTIFLDTNVLFGTALERARHFDTLGLIAKALKQLDARVVVLPQTLEEYKRAVAGRTPELLRVANRFSVGVLNSISNPIIATAVSLGCTNKEDLKEFLSHLYNPPALLGDDVVIETLDTVDCEKAYIAGSIDTNIKRSIRESWQTSRIHRNRTKGEGAIEHDAGLFAVVNHLRQNGERAWVLTLDLSMNALALDKSSSDELPSWITVDALTQVMALTSAGQIGPADFGRILSGIVANDLQPPTTTYQVEDLALMLDIEERCADLPDDRVREIAFTVSRMRLDPAVNEESVRLTVVRAFQGDRLQLANRVQESKANLVAVEDELGRERKLRVSTSRELASTKQSNLRQRLLIDLTIKGAMAFVIGLGLLAVGVYLILTHHDENDWLVWGSILTTLGISVSGYSVRYTTTALMRYRVSRNDLRASSPP